MAEHSRRRHVVVAIGAAVALCLLVAVIVAAVAAGHRTPSSRAVSATTSTMEPSTPTTTPTTIASATTTTTTVTPMNRTIVAPMVGEETYPASTLVATLHTSVPKYAEPGGKAIGIVPGSWYGAPSALPVIGQSGKFLHVRLAQRPDGSTAWIAASEATLSSTPYRIEINLSTMHVLLFKGSAIILDAPAGVGTTLDPTPTGNYFVAFYAAPPSPGYGPFVLVTSGHSNAISDWEQSGDAIIAIHGPLGEDAAIGTTGARISHGCIRLHDSDLVKLRQVPPGSPIDIVA